MEQNLSSRFSQEIARSIVGLEGVTKLMLVSLLSQGHVLLEGNPGLGKTTLAKAFSQTIGGVFKRIQMTPDTLPADILGTFVYEQKTGKFKLHKGPIFGNVILVDELNRATPKAQAALLESMQERQVTYEGETTSLDEPFIVLATQIPFGSAGTYPLSEVQADRFAFSVQMEYPTVSQEIDILSRIDEIEKGRCNEVMPLSQIAANIELAKQIYVSVAVKNYIVSLSRYLRESDNIKSPPSIRGSIALHKGARALAMLEGRDHVIPDDVKFLCPYVFSHRIVLTTEALTEEVSVSQMINEMLSKVEVPKE